MQDTHEMSVEIYLEFNIHLKSHWNEEKEERAARTKTSSEKRPLFKSVFVWWHGTVSSVSFVRMPLIGISRFLFTFCVFTFLLKFFSYVRFSVFFFFFFCIGIFCLLWGDSLCVRVGFESFTVYCTHREMRVCMPECDSLIYCVKGLVDSVCVHASDLATMYTGQNENNIN